MCFERFKSTVQIILVLIKVCYEAVESSYSSSHEKHIKWGTGCIIYGKVDCKEKPHSVIVCRAKNISTKGEIM